MLHALILVWYTLLPTAVVLLCCFLLLQRVQVVLHYGVSQEVQLRAYLHATHLAMTLNTVSG
jgi:hypothetical protein